MALFVAATIYANRRFDRRQRERAALRVGMDREAFERWFSACGVRAEISSFVWQALGEHCCAGVLPHPSDGLLEFYGLDGDELGDVIEEAFECLGLPMPSVRRPEIVPDLITAGDLCLYLEACRHRLAGPT